MLAVHDEVDSRRSGMADGVCERLLGDAVHHELGLRIERRQVWIEVVPDRQAGLVADAARERPGRAHEPEVFERVRSQPCDDAPNVLQARARRFLRVRELNLDLGRRTPRGACELGEQGGQRLADLVVQLPRDGAAFGLSALERGAGAHAPLGLQTVGHLVEAPRQLGHLATHAGNGEALAGLQGIHAPHRLAEALEGRERPADEQPVHDDHERHGDRQHPEVRRRGGIADRERRRREQRGSRGDHDRVREHDALKQRQASDRLHTAVEFRLPPGRPRLPVTRSRPRLAADGERRPPA